MWTGHWTATVTCSQTVSQRASSPLIDLFRSTVTSAAGDVAGLTGRSTDSPRLSLDKQRPSRPHRPPSWSTASHGVAGSPVIFLCRSWRYISCTTAALHRLIPGIGCWIWRLKERVLPRCQNSRNCWWHIYEYRFNVTYINLLSNSRPLGWRWLVSKLSQIIVTYSLYGTGRTKRLQCHFCNETSAQTLLCRGP